MNVMTMFATVDVTGYPIVSGSKLLLKEINVTFIVINVINNPKDNVATITDRIAGNSVIVIPQNMVPKTIEMMLMVALVAKVKTTIAPISL